MWSFINSHEKRKLRNLLNFTNSGEKKFKITLKKTGSHEYIYVYI